MSSSGATTWYTDRRVSGRWVYTTRIAVGVTLDALQVSHDSLEANNTEADIDVDGLLRQEHRYDHDSFVEDVLLKLQGIIGHKYDIELTLHGDPMRRLRTTITQKKEAS